MVQIDGPRRQVYIMFVDFQPLQDVLHLTNGQTEYRHGIGEIFLVRIELARMGTRRVRIASLPLRYPKDLYGRLSQSMEKSRRFRKRAGRQHTVILCIMASNRGPDDGHKNDRNI